MNYASDNTGPMHPQVLDALVAANTGAQMPYGNDTIMDEVRASLRDVFEAPEAAVYLVSTGTAANALALASYANPWDAIFCHRTAHVEEDECGAPEFYSAGAKLTLVDGEDGKMHPDGLRAAILGTGNKGVHGVQRGPVTLTQATEVGTIYDPSELAALTAVAKEFGLATHLDGARFANAMVTLGCSAAEMSWKAGIDVLSFGGTKNGCAGVEAVIMFDPQKAWEFELRRKRAGHLQSKHRYLSGQMQGYLAQDLWLKTAKMANDACGHLAQGLAKIDGAKVLHQPQANMIFADLPRRHHRILADAGVKYYLSPSNASLDGPEDELITCRMVCDWTKTPDDIEALLTFLR